jgi:hypothetical protein
VNEIQRCSAERSCVVRLAGVGSAAGGCAHSRHLSVVAWGAVWEGEVWPLRQRQCCSEHDGQWEHLRHAGAAGCLAGSAGAWPKCMQAAAFAMSGQGARGLMLCCLTRDPLGCSCCRMCAQSEASVTSTSHRLAAVVGLQGLSACSVRAS